MNKEQRAFDFVEDTFSLKVDFQRGKSSADRVFDTMAKLIRSTEISDRRLLHTVLGEPRDVQAVLLLEDIQIGSLISRLKIALTFLDDDALHQGDWKKVVGRLLLKIKFMILEETPEKNEELDSPRITRVQEKISIEIEKESSRIPFPFTVTPSQGDIIETIDSFQHPLGPLLPAETASLILPDGRSTPILPIQNYDKDQVIQAVGGQTLENHSQMLLIVKKPAYVGSSQWEFIYDNRTLRARIDNESWLARFQNRELDIRPGDSLLTGVHSTVIYGAQSEVLKESYVIVGTPRVVKQNRNLRQGYLFDDSEEQDDDRLPPLRG